MDKIKHSISLDCERLIEMFARNESHEFAVFCKEWKKILFHQMYSALQRDIEIIQMTEHIFQVAGRMLFENEAVRKPKERKIGVLYLVYAVYFKQPTDRYVKFKLTLEKWKFLKEFIKSITDDPSTIQARYIFLQLLAANAFRFVVMERDYGLEDILNGDLVKQKKKRRHIWDTVRADVSELNHSKSGLLESLSILEGGYNEMKRMINEQAPKYQSQLDIDTFADGINEVFKNISDALKPDFEMDKDKSEIGEIPAKIMKDLPIDEQRKKIKKKAYKTEVSGEGSTQNVFMAGDIIHIARDDLRPRTKVQTVQSMFEQALPEDALEELTKGDDCSDPIGVQTSPATRLHEKIEKCASLVHVMGAPEQKSLLMSQRLQKAGKQLLALTKKFKAELRHSGNFLPYYGLL